MGNADASVRDGDAQAPDDDAARAGDGDPAVAGRAGAAAGSMSPSVSGAGGSGGAAMNSCGDADGTRVCEPCPMGYRPDGTGGCRLLSTIVVGSSEYDAGYDLAVDSSGNLVVVGGTKSSLEGQSAGDIDIIVIKYGPDGQQLWSAQLGSPKADIATSVALGDDGSVYVACATDGGLEGSDASRGSRDACLVKYGADGQLQWTRQLGTTLPDAATGVAVDARGDVFLFGAAGSDLTDQPLGGTFDLFLAKYDSVGQRLWTRSYGANGMDGAAALALDPSGNVYFGGSSSGELDGIGPLKGIDALLFKVTGNGDPVWTRRIGSEGVDRLDQVAVDAAGHVVAAGTTAGSLDGNPSSGGSELFVVEYDAAGERLWTTQFGAKAILNMVFVDASGGLAIASDGSIYVSGATNGAFGSEQSTGLNDLFTMKLDAAGQRLWALQLGSSRHDFAGGLALDEARGDLYSVGSTEGDIDSHVNAGLADLVVLRFSLDGERR